MTETIRTLLSADPFELALMGASTLMAAASIVLGVYAMILRGDEADEWDS